MEIENFEMKVDYTSTVRPQFSAASISAIFEIVQFWLLYQNFRFNANKLAIVRFFENLSHKNAIKMPWRSKN